MSVNMVVMDENESEVEEMRAFLISLGMKGSQLNPIPCFSRGGHNENHDNTLKLTSSEHCLYTRKSLFIGWDGKFYPCSSDIKREFSYSSLNTFDTEKILEHWRKNLVCKPTAFEICKKCDHFSRGHLTTEWFDIALLNSSLT